ncbi:MAG: phosphoribosyl-AMP cyclohydrolase [Thermomicrobiales bacterium]|nr:phosphoribosyl-AMP cyclohydrolase [Thermomicrobiales bacterium]
MNTPIDFDRHPLVPAVIQDDESRDVLMVGFMNRLAYERTQETGFVHFWSRSRNQLWKKGETSGHTQEVVSVAINCEDNSLLIQVIQHGAVCHTGHRTCYYRQVLPDGSLVETSDPVFDPNEVYAAYETSMEALWYGAYEYLRDHDLTDVSGTSRRLRSAPLAPFDRIADELEELAGVISGEHRHSDLESDLLLEGSQVLYWIAVSGAFLGLDYDALELTAGLSSHPEPKDQETVIDDLRAQAELWRNDGADIWEFELKETIWLVGEAMSAADIDPIRLIERDLAELQSRDYLADYFASARG